MAQTMQAQGTYDAGSRFTVQSGSGHSVTMDGDHLAGYSPMEMVLASLAACSGISVISILQKKREDVTHYEISVRGTRAETHPKVFEEIAVEHIVTGHAVHPQSVERAIELAETRYCGVSIMLGKAVKLTHTYRIIEM
ncbi:MAG TPA: OsmC family protein [Ktedonobacteraceae bacterium]|nr:OsmC family protein [Ktedonobacteraceae bacterium]